MNTTDAEVQKHAERTVLGSLLRCNDCIAEVVPLLLAEDFAVYAHQAVFAAVVELWSRSLPVSTVTLADELQRRGRLEDAGGYGALDGLLDLAPTGGDVLYHASLVRDRALLRRLAQAAGEIQRDALNPPARADDVLADAERRVLEVSRLGLTGESVPLAAAVDEAYDALDARRAGGTPGLPSGWLDLDRLTAGWQPGDLVVIAARPSVGKTALGLAAAAHAAVDLGRPVFFASLEQGRRELAERLLCARAGVDSHRLRRGTLSPDEVARVGAAGEVLRAAPLRIDDAPEQHAYRVGANARRMLARGGLALVVVDYLQLLRPDDPKAPRQEQVAGMSRRLKHLARLLRVPVLALAQLNREVEHRQGQRPRLADLRESGGIEADADVVILLHRPKPDDASPSSLLELIVAKHRNGPTGTVILIWDKARMKFDNYAPEFAPANGRSPARAYADADEIN
jgi:replicative DNA helicase